MEEAFPGAVQMLEEEASMEASVNRSDVTQTDLDFSENKGTVVGNIFPEEERHTKTTIFTPEQIEELQTRGREKLRLVKEREAQRDEKNIQVSGLLGEKTVLMPTGYQSARYEQVEKEERGIGHLDSPYFYAQKISEYLVENMDTVKRKDHNEETKNYIHNNLTILWRLAHKEMKNTSEDEKNEFEKEIYNKTASDILGTISDDNLTLGEKKESIEKILMYFINFVKVGIAENRVTEEREAAA